MGTIGSGIGSGIGSIINYVCQAGYLLEGIPIRRCLPTGLWSGKQPQCDERKSTLFIMIQSLRHCNTILVCSYRLRFVHCSRLYRFFNNIMSIVSDEVANFL